MQWQVSANRWHFRTIKRMNFSWTLVNISMTTGTTILMQPVSICWARGTKLALSFISFITDMQNFILNACYNQISHYIYAKQALNTKTSF